MSEGSRSTHSSELLQVLVSPARGRPLQEVERVQCGNLHSVPISGTICPGWLFQCPYPISWAFPYSLKNRGCCHCQGIKRFVTRLLWSKPWGKRGRMLAKRRLLDKWGPTVYIHLASVSDSTQLQSTELCARQHEGHRPKPHVASTLWVPSDAFCSRMDSSVVVTTCYPV